MKYIQFEWSSDKEKSNIKKHGISFEEAKSSFFDEKARIIYDNDHSYEEDRFILLGFSNQLNILIVSHCYRQNDEIIRIISARKANQFETKQYGELQNER
ncbi:MAG: hypothetical protein A2096_08815 [Spirochaetes bacterium GWF1_41_5]|nr:MAG: hypothetical protein A2096_08815 [Spirochaetes bacterium GWF1_41_5]